MMQNHTITEARLLELGEAERVLNWVRGSVKDLERGRNAIEVFAEVVGLLEDDLTDPNGPAPLTPAEVLTNATPGWK